MSFNLGEFYAKIPEKLVEAQGKLESAIESFGEASEANTAATIEYRKAKASAIKRMKEEGMSVTLIGDIVQGETADLKSVMLRAENSKRKCLMLYEAFRERLFTLRAMNRGTESIAK